MTMTNWAVLIIGSGLAAGVANNLVSFLTGFLERKYRTVEREKQEQHAATLARSCSRRGPEHLSANGAVNRPVGNEAGV